MPSNITRRLEAAIREADIKNRNRLRLARAVKPDVAKAFAPVTAAAREIRDHLRSVPGLQFTLGPDSVSIALGDQELWLSYDPLSGKFVGEESAHSWYDGERYAERYEWSSAEACTDALIRFCAQYVRMARAINQATPHT
jgi:hypothetical protein